MARPFSHPGFMVIALGISIFLWMVAQGSTSIERAFDEGWRLMGFFLGE